MRHETDVHRPRVGHVVQDLAGALALVAILYAGLLVPFGL